MTVLNPFAVAAAATLLSLGSIAPQSASPTTQQPAPMSLVGCVERVSASMPARGTMTSASAAAAYKLIDVQPGTGTRTTLKADSQFLLAVAATVKPSIDLGKFQNQWVEVTGTVSAAPAATAKPAAPDAQALPTLTLTSLKMVSTECK